MQKSKKREFARDIIALGSIPFYFIVFIRSIITGFHPFIIQLIVAAILIGILWEIIADANLYISRAITLFAFTSIYYKSTVFTVFALLLLVGLFFSARHNKVTLMQIFRGALVGVLAIVGAYYLEPIITSML